MIDEKMVDHGISEAHYKRFNAIFGPNLPGIGSIVRKNPE